MMRFSSVLGGKSRPVLRPAPGACLAAVAASILGLRTLLPAPCRAARYGRLYPSSLFAFGCRSCLSDEEHFFPTPFVVRVSSCARLTFCFSQQFGYFRVSKNDIRVRLQGVE